MGVCFFISDLHGSVEKFEKLIFQIKKEKPSIVFIGGDITPSPYSKNNNFNEFITDYIAKKLLKTKNALKEKYPNIYIILGNDDPRTYEEALIKAEQKKLCEYIHNKKVNYGEYSIFGYSFIPPSPFLLKDWEKYDVSRYIDPGCVAPTEGYRSYKISKYEMEYSTIKKDLDIISENQDLSKSIFLFHSPPYQTNLDRAALDGKYVDHVPIDVHIGSIAIKQFIETKQPYITLHGHVHESSSITGKWSQKIKKTHIFSATYDKQELAIVKFNIENPEHATRMLI